MHNGPRCTTLQELHTSTSSQQRPRVLRVRRQVTAAYRPHNRKRHRTYLTVCTQIVLKCQQSHAHVLYTLIPLLWVKLYQESNFSEQSIRSNHFNTSMSFLIFKSQENSLPPPNTTETLKKKKSHTQSQNVSLQSDCICVIQLSSLTLSIQVHTQTSLPSVASDSTYSTNVTTSTLALNIS